MVISETFGVTYVMIAVTCLGAVLVGGLLTAMHLRHQYHPNLIGALIGALLCFLVLEALPALT